MRPSTASWIVAGIASAESAASPEIVHCPVASAAMAPEPSSERTSSLVKKGFPSVPS